MPVLSVSCAKCDSEVVFDEGRRGTTSRCPNCASWLNIPNTGTPPSAAPRSIDATEIIDERPKFDHAWGKSISDYMDEEGLRSCVDLRPDEDDIEHTHVVSFQIEKRKTTGDPVDILETEHGRKYNVGGLIAMGGMGTVLNARDMNIRRPVAMKIMRDLKDMGKIDKLRFVEEAQVTGQLEHPNIVPVHELGVDSQGKVFYTMKYVEGMTLRHILDRVKDGDKEMIARHPLNHLLNVFLKACDAVAFANSRGVVHRDLKPENIMVCDFGEVLVMDWGLAKIIGREETETEVDHDKLDTAKKSDSTRRLEVKSARQEDASLKTSVGMIMGTPAYMAPEQARGKVNSIDQRTDIYALGGILYHILTLRIPIEGEALREVVRRVISGDVYPPQFWNHDGGHRRHGIPHTRLRHAPRQKVPDGLAAVAMKAMSVEPDDRYQSAPELQREIEAWQSGFATGAEDASLWRQLILLYMRHKKEVSMVACGLALLVAVIFGFVVKLRWSEQSAIVARDSATQSASLAQRSRDSADQARQQAEDNAQRATAQKNEALAAREAEQTQRERAEHALLAVKQENYYNTISLAEKKIEDLLFDHAERLLLSAPAEFRGWEWGRLLRLCRMDLLTISQHSNSVNAGVWSPDGKVLATVGSDRLAVLVDRATGKKIRTFKGHEEAIRCVAFTPDAKLLITGSDDFTARAWDVSTGKQLRLFKGHTGTIGSLSVASNGKRLLTGSDDGTARIWDIASGRELLVVKGHASAVRSVAFSPDLKHAMSTSANDVLVWDAETGRVLRTLSGHTGSVYSVACSHDGRYVVTGSDDRTARVWNTKTGKEVTRLSGHKERITSVAFSRYGHYVATGSTDKTVMLWNVKYGSLARVFRGHREDVSSVSFSPEGEHLLSTAADMSARIWDVERGGEFVTLVGHDNWVSCLAFSPDSSALATGSTDKTIRVWNVRTGVNFLTLGKNDVTVNAMAFSPNGRLLATGGAENIRVWALDDGRQLAVLGQHKIAVHSVVFSPDSQRIAACHWSNDVRVFDVKTEKEVLTLKGHKAFVRQVAFSPDGQFIATASEDKTIGIWDAKTGKLQRFLKQHQSAVNAVSFAADGRLISGSDDRTACVWDLKKEDPILVLKGHFRSVRAVMFSPGGRRVVTVDTKAVRLWDAGTGREISTLKDAGKVIAFSPDGLRIASNTWGKTAKIWEAFDGRKPVGELDHERRRRYLDMMSALEN